MAAEEVLVGGKSLDWIFQQIAENNDEKALNAAQDIIRSASDRELRSEFISLVTKYQTAKDSVEMHTAFEDIISYVKRQYALILIQGFRFGQGYQQKIANEAFATILKGAAAQAEAEALKLKEEKSSEDTGTASAN